MYKLRSFTREDIPKLLSWMHSAKDLLIWTGSGYKWPLDSSQLEETLVKANKSNSKYQLLKFVTDNSMIGYIELKIHDSNDNTAHIGRLIIDPKMRGRGLGIKLINLLKKYAQDVLNIKTLTLGVYSSNQTARSLYERTGFIVTDIKAKSINFKNEQWDLVLMECQLQ